MFNNQRVASKPLNVVFVQDFRQGRNYRHRITAGARLRTAADPQIIFFLCPRRPISKCRKMYGGMKSKQSSKQIQGIVAITSLE